MSPRHTFSLLVVSLGIALSLAVPAQAQTGGIEGDVIGIDGKALVGVLVEIERTDMKARFEVKTDDKGHYIYYGLPAGRARYNVRVLQNGKVVYQFTGVQIPFSEVHRLDFNLKELRKEDEARMTEEQKRQIEAARKAVEKDKALREEFEVGVKLLREPSAELVCTEHCKGNTTDSASCLATCQEQASQNLQQMANQEAAAAFERAAVIDPSQYAVWANLGRVYQAENNLEKSISSYEKALTLKSDEAGLYVNLSQVYARADRGDDARGGCEKASVLDPKQAGACYFNIGVILYNNNQCKAAVEPLRKATEIDPQRAEAFYWLGVCLFNTAETAVEGDKVKIVLKPGTRESFEQYLALEPNGRYANDAKAMLSAVEVTAPASVNVKKKRN